ncbi:hypothetical protein [Isobaculum melis]|uniref:Uncharacterized protein n=1 Tax=Isobaculum melis TaxID=142588 RepID=A0A1H9QUW0_9LACT|nr:hypothetical protein [Isobaculum melis]SER64262.1 hypothetical protein SAMN04488559_102301 [Isobaculum melis]
MLKTKKLRTKILFSVLIGALVGLTIFAYYLFRPQQVTNFFSNKYGAIVGDSRGDWTSFDFKKQQAYTLTNSDVRDYYARNGSFSLEPGPYRTDHVSYDTTYQSIYDEYFQHFSDLKVSKWDMINQNYLITKNLDSGEILKLYFNHNFLPEKAECYRDEKAEPFTIEYQFVNQSNYDDVQVDETEENTDIWEKLNQD